MEGKRDPADVCAVLGKEQNFLFIISRPPPLPPFRSTLNDVVVRRSVS